MLLLSCILIGLLEAPLCNGANDSVEALTQKAKFLSIFSIVRFDNAGCVSTNNLYNGTCLTAAECRTASGTAYGSCASGFGVCCVIKIDTCGSTTNRNCTYFQNPGYPSTVSPPLQCSLQVNKMRPDICQLRIDFQNFVLAQPDSTAYSTSTSNFQGQCVVDTFTVSGASNSVPSICGTNTGQHIYVDTSSGQNSFTLSFSIGLGTTSLTTGRSWSIKVCQLPCDAISNAPPGCLQYYTSTAGTLSSFNYDTTSTANTYMLANQDYTVCIRTAQGFCGICYSTCTGTTPQAFGISGSGTATLASSVDCTTDWIQIPSGFAQGSTKSSDRFCGGSLAAVSGDPASPICSTSKPFELRVHTDSNEAATDQSVGFCLNYNQVPCISGTGTNG